MNEKLLKKLRESLTKAGLAEEEIEGVIQEVETEEDETPVGEAPIAEEETETAEEPKEAEKGEIGDEPTEPAGEEEAAPEVTEEEPTEEPIEEPAPEPEPEPEAGPEPTVEAAPEEPTPEEAPAQPQPTVDYEAKYREAMKAIEGLTFRFESLTDALEKAGVLMPSAGQAPAVGVDDNYIPANDTETPMDDIVARINKGRRY